MRKSQFDYDCIVVGGGPGGLVSALYLGRFRRNVLLVDAGRPRARWIPRIRNLIGYAQGLSGLELLKRLREQVALYPHVKFLEGVAHVNRARKGFIVEVGGRQFTAGYVILATGLKDLQPDWPNLNQLRSTGVLGYCPICDGYDHAEQKVALFVKSSRVLKKVKFISDLCPQLTVIPTEKIEPTPAFLKLIKERNLKWVSNPVDHLKYDNKKNQLCVFIMGKSKPLKFDFGYVAMGVDFDTTAIRHLKGLRRVRDGFIQTSSHQETSIHGLYAVGDCVNALAQVSVAIGQAALAATRIHRQLTFYSHIKSKSQTETPSLKQALPDLVPQRKKPDSNSIAKI